MQVLIDKKFKVKSQLTEIIERNHRELEYIKKIKLLAVWKKCIISASMHLKNMLINYDMVLLL